MPSRIEANKMVHSICFGSFFILLTVVLLWPGYCLADTKLQVQARDGDVVAESGIKEGEFSFDAKGSLTAGSGYFQGKDGKTYTIKLHDDKGEIAYVECKGRIEWDAQGRIIEGKNNFLNLTTKGYIRKWHKIISTEIEQGVLIISMENGTYTDFSEKRMTVPARTKQRVLAVSKQGYLVGEPRFILSTFFYDFTGIINKDTRNYKFVKE